MALVFPARNLPGTSRRTKQRRIALTLWMGQALALGLAAERVASGVVSLG
jgi:hypothetical protein